KKWGKGTFFLVRAPRVRLGVRLQRTVPAARLAPEPASGWWTGTSCCCAAVFPRCTNQRSFTRARPWQISMTGRVRPQHLPNAGSSHARIATSHRGGSCSKLAWPVDVGAVLDGHHVDAAALVVNAVNHPVVAAAGAVQTLQPEPEWLAGPVRAGCQRPVQELHHG